MSINRMYKTGIVTVFMGIITFNTFSYFIGGFLIGLGFILVLKSYGNK